jgi:hypothetical protein
MRDLSVHRRVGLLAAALSCATALSAERYEGLAYPRHGEALLYREIHWQDVGAGGTRGVVLYECPDGQPFARKLLQFGSATAPDFSFEDARDGYREGVRSPEGHREVFVQEGRAQAVQVQPLPDIAGLVIDAGFDAFIRTHWEQLLSGAPLSIAFLIPSRFDTLELKLQGAHRVAAQGEPVMRLSMRLAAWYGFALPGFELTYDRQGGTLRQFEGIGTVRDQSGHNQEVRIVFPPARRSSGDFSGEMDAALGRSLVGHCSD